MKPEQIVAEMLDANFDPKDYVQNPHLPEKIEVDAKYYYPRGGGTPYHIVKIWVNDNLAYTSPILCTGGPNQYLETANEWLEQHMVIPVRPPGKHGGKEALWYWAHQNNVKFSAHSEDVRKKAWLR